MSELAPTTAYQDYTAWKGWKASEFLKLSEYEFHYFEREFRGFDFRDKRVLELGFGNGEFLAYAKSRGAILWGTELIEELCNRAKLDGTNTLSSDLGDVDPALHGTFDLIVALDVFEHIEFEHLQVLLERSATLLAPGGTLIARFPNGQSPFGRIYQHGDHTHRVWLSATIFEHLCNSLDFDFVSASRPARPNFGALSKRIGRWVKYNTQNALEAIVNKAYAMHVPLSPNVLIRLRRKST